MRIRRGLLVAVAMFAFAVWSTPARAAIIVLDFEGIGELNPVGDFYNGAGPADKDFGISFSPETLALVDADAGGSGNFANEPSPDTIMFFLNANNAILNVAAGFDTGFSFFYSSSTAAAVNVWSELDGTGVLLATLNLVAQFSDNCVGDPTGDFCNWTAIGVLFAGVAKSIDFGGTANFTGFDDITFGTDIPGGNGVVPEPATLLLIGSGLAAAGLRRRRQRA